MEQRLDNAAGSTSTVRRTRGERERHDTWSHSCRAAVGASENNADDEYRSTAEGAAGEHATQTGDDRETRAAC